MSDTPEVQVEKSAEEQVVATFADLAETKADKSDLETKANIADIPSIEGFVKADDVASIVDSAVAEVKESMMDMEAKLSAPVVKAGGSTTMIKFEKMDTELGMVQGQKFDIIQKRQGDNTDVPGGLVDSNAPYFFLQQANPFRQYGTVLPASGGVVKLPSVAGITWTSEANQPAAARTPGGTSTSKNIIIETWVSENEYSIANLEDVPAMDGAITGLMTDNLGLAEATDGVAVVKAATAPTSVTTGLAAALPTAANIVSRLTMVASALGSAYTPGARWLMSRPLWARLQESNNNGLNFDPMNGIATLFGYPVNVVDQLEAGGTAGDLSGIFGQISNGVALATAADLTIGRFDQTRPGSMTYFGRTRFKHSVWNEDAIIRFTTGA